MKIVSKWMLVSAVVSLAVLLSMIVGLPAVQGQASFVRWDIISLNPTTTPNTLSAGGVAFANTSNPGTLKIKLTGFGTFVAPASGETSSAVTGGGTWETFSCPTSSTCTSTGGPGTYEVRGLVSWQFANLATSTFIDLIDEGRRANGNAVLRIQYSDGSEGVLGVGCHGPGGPDGIEEGVIATKGFKTYWTGQPPSGMPFVDANRTVFHVR